MERALDALEDLSPEEREVIRLRFAVAGGRGCSRAEVAKRLRIPITRVSGIELRALRKLRDSGWASA
jgi:RNA polymerase sigma factor (sigma-70 family)